MKVSVAACMATTVMVVAAAAAMVVADLVATPMLTVINGRQSRSKLSQKVF